MSELKELSTDVRKRFKDWQKYKPKSEAESVEATLNAVVNVAQAFSGLVTEERVIAAIGSAESPNAVSRAVRSKLPPL